MSIIWTHQEVLSKSSPWSNSVWRMVESQHMAATMKLVDNANEQDLLESLLDSSKPTWPIDTAKLNYLLATPFRYNPKREGSRFRGVNDPGVFYGAETVRTAGAELGYWRWKFLQDAVDLERIEPVAHTAFKVDIATTVVDLQKVPFSKDAKLWEHPENYEPTQQFSKIVRSANVGGILYKSVRDPISAWCLALLTPQGFSQNKPHIESQTWYLAVSSTEIILRGDGQSLQFSTMDW